MPEKLKSYEKSAPKVFIRTFGCQMNEYDSGVMAGILQGEGYLLTEIEEEADLVLLNTCSVRQHAEDKVLSRLGRLSRLKEKRPQMRLGLAGCMAERLKDELFRLAPSLDFVLGPNNIDDLLEILRKIKNGSREILATGGRRNPCVKERSICQNSLTAYLPIVFGCNHFCSYCIVPYVRGRQTSREMDVVLKEARELAGKGYKEITLLGQQVNAYGQDMNNGTSLALLLEEIDWIDGIERIRFVTAHPSKMDDYLIEAVARLKKVCEHIHLPLQSGSDKVLQGMNRGYTRDEYIEIVRKLRQYIAGISITTDVIVGFPGETEADFEETLNLMEEIRLDGAFMFRYSPRSGTRAATLPNQIEEGIKRERLLRLIDLQNRITREKNDCLVGRCVEVMVTSSNPRIKEELMGRTRSDKVVIFPGSKDLIGESVTVKILNSGPWHLRAMLVQGPGRPRAGLFPDVSPDKGLRQPS